MITKLNPSLCLGEVWDNGAWHPRQCSKKPATAAGYCKKHDPEIVAAKQAAKVQRFEDDWQARKQRFADLEAKKARLFAIVNDEAREILRELGVAP